MDSEVSEKAAPRQVRRSTRQSSANAKAVNFEPTPRGPLKRTKKPSKPQSEVSAVNGTKEADNSSDDAGSPQKKRRLQTGETLAGGDGAPQNTPEPMDTLEKNEDQEDTMKSPVKFSEGTHIHPGPLGDVNLEPFVVLGQRCSLGHTESESINKSKRVEQPKKDPVSSSKFTTQVRPSERTFDTHYVRVTSMADYQRKMEDGRCKITEKKIDNHYITSSYPKSLTSTTTRQRTTDSSTQKRSVPEKKQERTKKSPVSPQSSGSASKGFLWYLWQLILLMLLSAGLFLAFRNLPTFQRTKDVDRHFSRPVNSGRFVEELSRVHMNYPSQRPELWKRSQIHIQKHLDTPQPTEPVSLILTAGVKAEKTLRCLAHSIVSAFSSALNASAIHIDGASKAKLDSDQVKMDIDNQLKAAFGGDKLAAVIHRFEMLPPGSTLIFYRYCDHETAAYKRALLLFTVLLSEEDLSSQHSLKEVEEMVRDYVIERFVGNETAFNKMDLDKFSGLWSRIAHLILPVVYENEVEQRDVNQPTQSNQIIDCVG